MSQIKRDIKSLLKSSIIVKPLEVIKGFFVLKFLTPEMYGLLNIINQISSFAKYGDLGFISVVEREYNYEVVKDKNKAEYIKNIAYSSELLLAVCLSVLVFLVSFFYIDSMIIFIGIISASLMLFISKINRLYSTHLRINKEFNRFAKYNTLNGILISLSIISTVSFIGIYAPLIVGTIAGCIVAYIMYKKINLNFTFLLEKEEVLRQLKVGVTLGGLTFVYGLGIYLERFIIVKDFGLEGVGFFAFGMFIVMFFQYFMYDFVRPYMPTTKEALANNNKEILKQNVAYPTVKLVVFVIPFIYLLQFIIPYLITNFFEQYVGALEIFRLLSFLLMAISISTFSGYLLYSQGINKTYHAYISHFIYIFIILLCLIVKFESLEELVYLFVIGTFLKSFYQTYFVLNEVYNGFYLSLVLGLILGGILWLI